MDTIIGFTGTIGIVFMLLGYFLLVTGKIKAADTHHILLNVLGALLIAIALHIGQAVPFFPAIIGWLMISLFGFYKHHIAVTE